MRHFLILVTVVVAACGEPAPALPDDSAEQVQSEPLEAQDENPQVQPAAEPAEPELPPASSSVDAPITTVSPSEI